MSASDSAGGHPRCRSVDDLPDPLTAEQGQRIDKDQSAGALARQFGGAAQHHSAGAGAGPHDVVEALLEQQLGDLGGMGFDGDPGLTPGNPAAIVVIDAKSPEQAIAQIRQPLAVWKRGRRTATRRPVQLHRPMASISNQKFEP